MISQLEGTAAQWQNFLDMEVLQQRRAPLQAWREWAAELVARFEPMNALERARNQLDSLRQTTTVLQYVREFQRLMFQIPLMTREEALHRFIRGLKPELQYQLTAQNPPTLEDAILLAERLDVLYKSTRSGGSGGKGAGGGQGGKQWGRGQGRWKGRGHKPQQP